MNNSRAYEIALEDLEKLRSEISVHQNVLPECVPNVTGKCEKSGIGEASKQNALSEYTVIGAPNGHVLYVKTNII